MGVEVEYRNLPTGDIADMMRIIKRATASGPNGIITTLADFDMLNGPIEAAADSGVDMIVMNTGAAEKAREVGALMYVGQPECDAGHAAGLRAKGDGVTSFLCVNHSTQQPTLAERGQGFADGLGIETGAAMLDCGADPAEIKNEVLAYPSANPNTDAILTLDETGMAGDIYFGPGFVTADGPGSIEKYAGEYTAGQTGRY